MCGLTFSGSQGRPGVWWYRCNGQLIERGPHEGRCPSAAVRGDQFEPLVWADIERWLRHPGEMLAELDVADEREGARAVAEAESITLAATLESLQEQRQRALALAVRGRLDDAELDGELERIAAESAEIERRLTSLSPAPEPELSVPSDLLEQVRARLDAGLSIEERQEVVRLLTHIVVQTDVPGTRERRARAVVTYRFPEPPSGVVVTCTSTGSSRQ